MMKRLLIVFTLILALTFTSCSNKKDAAPKPAAPSQDQTPQQSHLKGVSKTAAPDFTLTSLKGEKVTLSDLKGKVVVLNFFATWCGPCKAEMPGFVSTMEEYGEKNSDVVFLFINVDEDKGTVESFLKDRNYNDVDPLMDNGDVYSLYTLRGGIPTTTIVDKDGNIALQHEGLMYDSDLKAGIEKVLE